MEHTYFYYLYTFCFHAAVFYAIYGVITTAIKRNLSFVLEREGEILELIEYQMKQQQKTKNDIVYNIIWRIRESETQEDMDLILAGLPIDYRAEVDMYITSAEKTKSEQVLNFFAHLIRTPDNSEFTKQYCTHVSGKYWIYEGDIELLENELSDSYIVAEGNVPQLGGLSGPEITKGCEIWFLIDIERFELAYSKCDFTKF